MIDSGARRHDNRVSVERLADFAERIDVRSPSEYAEDHLPGAASHPVLDDAERARIGTMHAEESAFAARRAGAALVARNIAGMIETSFGQKPPSHASSSCIMGKSRPSVRLRGAELYPSRSDSMSDKTQPTPTLIESAANRPGGAGAVVPEWFQPRSKKDSKGSPAQASRETRVVAASSGTGQPATGTEVEEPPRPSAAFACVAARLMARARRAARRDRFIMGGASDLRRGSSSFHPSGSPDTSLRSRPIPRPSGRPRTAGRRSREGRTRSRACARWDSDP